MTGKVGVPTVGTIWTSVLHKYSDNYAKYALEYFECFFAETPHHPTKISRSAFVYWGLSVVGCLQTPHQHYTNTPPNSRSKDLGYFYGDNLVIRLITMILTFKSQLFQG